LPRLTKRIEALHAKRELSRRRLGEGAVKVLKIITSMDCYNTPASRTNCRRFVTSRCFLATNQIIRIARERGPREVKESPGVSDPHRACPNRRESPNHTGNLSACPLRRCHSPVRAPGGAGFAVMPRSSNPLTALLWGTLLCVAGAGQACHRSNALEPLEPQLELVDGETSKVRVRYTTGEGLPVGDALIRFEIDSPYSPYSPAWLSTYATRTNQDGVATAEVHAQQGNFEFVIVARANSSDATTRIDVKVSSIPGGQLEVQLRKVRHLDVDAAEVLVVDHLDCDSFDEFDLPPPSVEVVGGRQTFRWFHPDDGLAPVSLGLPPDKRYTEHDLVFRGLTAGKRYTVVAIGRSKRTTVARACVDGLRVSDEIGRRRRLDLLGGLELETVVARAGDELELRTVFSDLALRGLAELLDGLHLGAGPADHVVDQLRRRTKDDAPHLAGVLYRHRDWLVEAMLSEATAGEVSSSLGSQFARIAQALSRFNRVTINSRLVFLDDGDLTSGEARVEHRMGSFSFSLFSRKSANVGENERVFADPTPLELVAEATLRAEGDGKASLSPHRLSVPLVDALIGSLLFDSFGVYRFAHVLTQAVNCAALGMKAGEYAEQDGLQGWRLSSPLLEKLTSAGVAVAAGMTMDEVMGRMCDAELSALVADARRRLEQDLGPLASNAPLIFEGKANLLTYAKGSFIRAVKDGQWIGLGTFEGSR
jgi:hypothetical protein